MNRFLHRHLLLPAFESLLKRRKTFGYQRELEHSQWLGWSEIEAKQFESLRGLLAHAYENCPYYRDAWLARGLDPRGLRELWDFSRWPVIDRATITANRERMRSRLHAGR